MRKTVGAKPVDLRRQNYQAIIQLFRNNPSLAVRDIMKVVNLSKTAITNILNNLVQMDIVHSIGKGTSTNQGGKKPELYMLNYNYRYVIVVYFFHKEYFCQLLNMEYSVIAECRYLSPQDNGYSYEEIIPLLVQGVREVLEKTALTEEQICGIVFHCPGIVLNKEGVLLSPIISPLWDSNLPVLEDIQKLLNTNIPLYIDNSSRYFGYSELLTHPERRNQNIITLFCASSSVGGSQIRFGHLVHGLTSLVGEYGHITTDYAALDRCQCGNYGCFEMSVSEDKVINRILRELKIHTDSALALKKQEQLSLLDVFQAANKGDGFARKHLDFIIQQFSVLIYNMQLTYDPDEIIIQGDYSRSQGYFQDTLIQTINQLVLHNIPNRMKLSFSEEANDSDDMSRAMVGAALFCYDQFFEQMTFV